MRANVTLSQQSDNTFPGDDNTHTQPQSLTTDCNTQCMPHPRARAAWAFFRPRKRRSNSKRCVCLDVSCMLCGRPTPGSPSSAAASSSSWSCAGWSVLCVSITESWTRSASDSSDSWRTHQTVQTQRYKSQQANANKGNISLHSGNLKHNKKRM